MESTPAPPPLVDRIEEYRSGTFRIDLLRRHGEGWRKVDGLVLDPTRTDDTGSVVEAVHRRAELDAEQLGHGGRYRAMMRRHILHEKEKRVATFDVETWFERRQRERTVRAARRRTRRADSLFDAWMLFSELVADHLEHDLDVMREMDRLRGREHRQQLDIARGLVMARAGLELQGEAARARAEARVRSALEDMRRRSSTRQRAALEPVLDAALTLFGARWPGRSDGNAMASVGEPIRVVAPRGRAQQCRETAPSNSESAASPGKDDAGA